jgi:hypothetical protein
MKCRCGIIEKKATTITTNDDEKSHETNCFRLRLDDGYRHHRHRHLLLHRKHPIRTFPQPTNCNELLDIVAVIALCADVMSPVLSVIIIIVYRPRFYTKQIWRNLGRSSHECVFMMSCRCQSTRGRDQNSERAISVATSVNISSLSQFIIFPRCAQKNTDESHSH